MASLASFAAVQPMTIKGLAGSSLTGTKLHIKPSCQTFKPISYKYSDSSHIDYNKFQMYFFMLVANIYAFDAV